MPEAGCLKGLAIDSLVDCDVNFRLSCDTVVLCLL